MGRKKKVFFFFPSLFMHMYVHMQGHMQFFNNQYSSKPKVLEAFSKCVVKPQVKLKGLRFFFVLFCFFFPFFFPHNIIKLN